jgi:hypothetical protein
MPRQVCSARPPCMEKRLKRMSNAGGQQSYTPMQQGGAALFYGVSSIVIMFINKIVLSIYRFPSFNFLATSQFVVTTVILLTLQKMGRVRAWVLAGGVERAPPAGDLTHVPSPLDGGLSMSRFRSRAHLMRCCGPWRP